jgi:protein Tex
MYLELMAEMRERAHEAAIQVFARNLKDLLLAAPAGARPTLGLDPGIRTGVKVGGGRCHGQAAGDGDDLPVPAEERPARREPTLLELIARTGWS